jgi:hypothetical protein
LGRSATGKKNGGMDKRLGLLEVEGSTGLANLLERVPKLSINFKKQNKALGALRNY